jgi:hypothetical protein
MTLEVTPVRGLRQLKGFIDLPYRLHAGTPWIPPLKEERYLFLTRRLNAFFTHGEGEYFLARRNGRVVGRITAHIDFAYNEFHGGRTGTIRRSSTRCSSPRSDGCASARSSRCSVRWTSPSTTRAAS